MGSFKFAQGTRDGPPSSISQIDWCRTVIATGATGATVCGGIFIRSPCIMDLMQWHVTLNKRLYREYKSVFIDTYPL